MQEAELLKEVESLQNLVQQQEDYGPDSGHQYLNDYDDEDEDEDEDDFNIHSPEPSWSRSPVNRRHRSLSDANARGTWLNILNTHEKLSPIESDQQQETGSASRPPSI